MGHLTPWSYVPGLMLYYTSVLINLTLCPKRGSTNIVEWLGACVRRADKRIHLRLCPRDPPRGSRDGKQQQRQRSKAEAEANSDLF